MKGIAMAGIINKTFGGLNRQYYFRHLFFALVIAAVMFWFKTAIRPPSAALVVWLGINTLLYPYARFVWESIVSFVTGANVFYLPAIVLLIAKLITMLVCWQMSILIAPVGLAWLYWHHSRGIPAKE